MRGPLGALLFACLALLRLGEAQILSVDLGHEFFKVALMRQGAPLEILLNIHGARKTPTATSFMEAVRTFGVDAVAHAGKAPAKVPMFFHSMLGDNFTADDVKPGGAWWDKFGFEKAFYTYDLEYKDERGVPAFSLGENRTFSGEEVLANVFSFAHKLAEENSEGKPVKDVVVTVPPEANLRFRQAIVAAGEIAGLRVLTLVHEGASFAVQRAVDFTPEKGSVERGLFYNLGSRKAEVTIVQFESRQAGMVAGKTAPIVTVLGSAMDYGIGGHLFDLKIASSMLKKFQDKYPKLADGILKNPRALRKLITQAAKSKAVLSANKAAPFIVESLYEDTDFQASIKREEFEEMCKDLFSRITGPIETALKLANTTLQEIQHVEVVGGGWRVPKVQQVLSEFIEQGAGKKIPLGQHLNGEEAAALGAALVGANSSSSFRVKKIFFSDISAHAYAVQVTSLTGEWEKNVTTLYPVGGPLGGKKKLSFTLEEDFKIKLFEDGVLLSEYSITGLADKLAEKWKDYNTTGTPKITVNVNLESSGLIEVKNPVATIEELYWVNETREKKKDENASANASANSTESAESAPSEEATNTSTNESNASNASAKEYEVVQKQKKKKHEKKLTVKRMDYKPVPLTDDQIADSRKQLEAMSKLEEEAQAVNAMKNELEAAIYGGRDKVEQEHIMKVSTEEQRTEITTLCTEYEEWMYEGGTSKADYESRLTKLKDLLGPIEERAFELDARSDIPESVSEALAAMNKVHTDLGKNKTWANETKVEAALKKITDFEEWWSKKQDSQKSLPLHEAPAYTKAEVKDKLSKLQKDWDKAIKAATKKPKEDKKKAKASNETKSSGDKKEAAEEALPTDAKAVEAELKTVREKKAAAVEGEDFDAAHAFKQREEKLKAHLAKLEKSEL